MTTLSSANAKYTAEQLAKATGISTETLATWGLTEATDTLTISQLAEMASSDAQAKTALDKIIVQNAQAVANGEVTASNIALATSEKGTALATSAFTTAIKANASAMKTWLLTTPAGRLTMLVGGIFLAVKAYDALTVSVEEQKEKMEDSLSAYEDAKSELSNITSELENQEKVIDDLLKKEKLTYAEKGQLEELQAITQELRIQKDLAEKEEGRTKKEVATNASDLFKKQFGKYDISESEINERQYYSDLSGNYHNLIIDKNDISAMIAGYKQFNKLLDEAYGSGSQEDIENYKTLTSDIYDSIFSTTSELQEQQSNISKYYEIIKNIPYEDLTPDQQEIVDSYNEISNIIALIYKQIKPDTWNSMQIDNLFATEGIEKTKEELLEMAKEGTLDENVIKSYSKLNSTLEDSNMVLSDGQSAANALCNEIYALINKENELAQLSSIDILPISSTIDQLNTRLKPSMDSLKSTWQDIFTDDELSLDNLDLLSTVDSIKSKLDELNKIDGITVDYSSFEDFVRILEDTESTEEDVKQGFNELAKSIVQASVSGIEDFQTLKDVLEDLGVVNNEIVAFQALAQNTDALKASGLDLLNATQSDIKAFASERVSVENLSEAIIYLTEQQKYLQFQTEINSFQNMDTSQEIANLKNLAKNAGITGDVISDLTELEQIYQAVASGVYGINTQQVAMAMERARQLKNKIQEEISKENLKAPEIEFPEVKFEPKIDESSAKKSADDLEKLTKDYVDSYMNYMEQSLKTGRIDYQTYAREVAKFLKDMYDQGKIAAKDYHDYTKQMLEVQKNVYDKALSAITRRLEKESEYYQGLIDEINKKNDSLEKQKDDYDSILSVVEKVYDKEIEALQEQQKAIDEKIDALRDANDEEERGIALANARYALEKAQQQRTRLVYTEGEGFIYKQDNEAIREARKELKDVELENTISQLEKEKEALDEDIENLEKYKDLWSEIPDLHQQAVNEKLAIDMFGADYEKVILQSREQAINEFANKYISIQQQVDDNNSLIESYEEKKEYYDKLREQWNDLTDVYEQSVEDQYAAMLYGVDWEDQILSGRIDYLNDFKDSYIEIQQAIVDAAWNSANEQVKAAKEAAKGADGNTNDITSLGFKKELDKNVEPNSKFNVTYGTTNPSEFEQKLNDVKKYGSLVVVESKKNNNNTNKLDEYYKKLKRGSKYASGTKNAKKGLNLVGEEGTETFVDNDGNVSLVTEPTLIPMKGGETVIKASETEKILTGIDNLVPLNWDEMWNKIKISPQAMPKFDLNIPDYSKMLSNAKSQDVSITQHIELTLPNVTNTSGVENVIETIRKLPLDALQYVNRR